MKNTVFFILIFLVPVLVFSQSEKQIDSLLVALAKNNGYAAQIATLNNICLEYKKNNTSKLKLYNQQILTLSQKNNYKLGFGLYYLNCSRIHLADNDGKKALEFSEKATSIFKKIKNVGKYLDAILEMSRDFIILSEIEKSKLVLKQNLKLVLQYKNNDIIVDYYKLLGANCTYQDSTAKSLFYYKKALPFLSQKKTETKSNFFQKISDQYSALNQNEKSLVYIDLSIESKETNYRFLVEAKKALILNNLKRYDEALNLSLKNYKSIINYKMTNVWQYNLILYNISNANYNLKNYNSAIQYINKAIDKKNTIPEYKIECFIILSNIYYLENKKNEARYYSNKALIFHDSLYANFGNFELFSNVSKIEEDAGNYKKALYFYQKQVNFTSKRNAQINNENNLLLQTDFDVTLKDYNIKTLQEEKAMKTIENLKQKNYIMLFGGLFLVALLSIFFFLRNNKTIKKKNKEIENEKSLTQKSLIEKEILLKEIHHRVKNNLQLVMSVLKIQGRDTNMNVKDFVKVSLARIRSMALIHENLYQTENSDKVDFKEYIENLTHAIATSHDAKEVQLKLEMISTLLDIQIAIPIGLIINELLSNAYKHAFEQKEQGVVLVKFIENKDYFQLIISDNGMGIHNSIKNEKSLGLELVKLLITQIKATLHVENLNGTTFTIQFQNHSV
jgi:two-component system, sensor histidine kinase PdtaS